MMLHSPGSAGISSPVDGMNGAIPILPAAAGTQTLTAASAASTQPLADLRWIATGVARPLPYAAALGQVTAASTPRNFSQATLDAARQTPLSVVVGMLGSWRQAAP